LISLKRAFIHAYRESSKRVVSQSYAAAPSPPPRSAPLLNSSNALVSSSSNALHDSGLLTGLESVGSDSLTDVPRVRPDVQYDDLLFVALFLLMGNNKI
jgi:hypothetical protein